MVSPSAFLFLTPLFLLKNVEAVEAQGSTLASHPLSGTPSPFGSAEPMDRSVIARLSERVLEQFWTAIREVQSIVPPGTSDAERGSSQYWSS